MIKDKKRRNNYIKNEIIGAILEIAGYTIGLGYHYHFMDRDIQNFNKHVVTVRDDLLEKVERQLG